MVVTSFGGCNEGGWTRGYQNLYLQEEEHGCAVHRYSPHYGPMYGYREEGGITDINNVVISVGLGINRDDG